MPVNLQGRSFLKLLDYTPDEIRYLLKLSADFKALKRSHTPHRILEGKNIVLLFEKTSTRTRCAFEVAASDLGMGCTYLDPGSSQMGNKESISDTAKVLGRFYDGIEYRGFSQDLVEELAANAGVPVWNGLTDAFHPTQMLADILTIQEEFGTVKGKSIAYFGDARNNVANSLMVVCAKLGIHYTSCASKSLWPDPDLVAQCQSIAGETGSHIHLTEDIEQAATGADALYTDIWVSMGEPKEIWKERIELLEPYRVDEDVMRMAKDDAIFLHCLPSFHDRNTSVGEEMFQTYGIKEMEVADSVFRGTQSRVFDQAENRMHTIKAVMAATLK